MSQRKKITLYIVIALGIMAGYYFLNVELNPLQLSWRIVVIIFLLNIFLIAAVILLEKRNPYKTIAWLLIFIVFPLGGYILYVFFGRNIRKEKILKDIHMCSRCKKILRSSGPRDRHGYPLLDSRIFRLMDNSSDLPLQFNNRVKVLTNGPATFREIIKALKKASHHIHMEYYIIRDDKLGRRIREILMEKARKGVEIRILYDGIGSLKLPPEFFQPLQDAGGKVTVFLPVKFPYIDYRANYRNHRKILVVDGKTGFLGGLNIGDEYLGKSRNFKFWRDTHLKLEGDSVQSLQTIFLQDWAFSTGEHPEHEPYFQPHDVTDQTCIQIVESGPDSNWHSILQLYLQMVFMAERKLYITTPYLIPDESLLTALKVSALSGVDVRLLVPGIPDKKIVQWASRSYYQELMEAGVRIYEYQRGFIHAKVVQVDHHIASVGTANLDIRSLHLDFEVNALIYDSGTVARLEEDFMRDLRHSIEIDSQQWEKRGLRHNLAESLARLLSPIL